MKETCLFVFSHQEEMNFHGFQDPLAILLQSSLKEEFVLFISSDFGFNLCFQLPPFTFVCLLKKYVIGENQEANCLIGCIGTLASLDEIFISAFRVGRSVQIIFWSSIFSARFPVLCTVSFQQYIHC
jgi:hypothetical protein